MNFQKQYEDNKTLPPPFDDDGADVSQWNRKAPSDYKDVVLRQIETCRIEYTKQNMNPGTFFTQTPSGMIPITLEDQRKIKEECTKTLYDHMLFYFDKTATDNIEAIDKKIKELNQKYFDKYLEKETNQSYKKSSEVTKDITIGAQSNIGRRILQQQADERAELYREINRELLLLFKRKNELSSKKTVSV